MKEILDAIFFTIMIAALLVLAIGVVINAQKRLPHDED